MKTGLPKRLYPNGITTAVGILCAVLLGGGLSTLKAQEPLMALMDGEIAAEAVPDSVQEREELWTVFCRAVRAEAEGEFSQALALYAQVEEEAGENAEIVARQATCYLEMREPAQAAVLGRRAVELDSLHVDALWASGAGLLATGELDDAVPYLSRLIEIRPSARHLSVLSNLLERLRRYEEALLPLNQLVAQNPASPRLLDRRAGFLTRLGRYDEAVGDYWTILQIAPEYPGLREQMTTLLKQLGRTPELIRFYRALVEYLPEQKRVHWQLIELLMDSGQWEGAEQELLAIRRLHPEDALPVLQLGLVSYRQGQIERALELIAEARTMGIQAEIALLWEMRIGFAEGNLEAALAAAQQLTEIAPETVEAWRVAGFSLADLGRPSEALSYVERWMYLDEADPEPALVAAALCRQLHSWVRGLEFVREALSREPDDDNVRLEFAAFLEANAKIDEATEVIDTVLAHAPEHAEALNFMGYMWIDRGMRLDEAETLIKRALKQDPQNPAFLDSMGWLWYKRGDLGRAEEWLNRAISLGGRHPEIYRHLAQVVLDAGRSAEAQKVIELGLKWNPEDPALTDFLLSLEDER